MTANVTLPGTGAVIETVDIAGVERQVVTIGDRAGNAVDVIGGLTETAPASDTASSGLNGRLQRIAQRLTTMLTGIVLAAGSAVIGKVGIDQTAGQNVVKTRFFAAVATTLTRPANVTAYSANDSISNNATAASVTALSATVSDTNDDPVCITAVTVDTNDTGLAAAVQVRAYLYNSDPTAISGVGAGDNAAFSNKRAGFIGSVAGTMRAFSDGGKARLVPEEGSYIVAKPASGAQTIFIQFQTLSAFTPSANSTMLIATLEGFQGRA